MRKEGWVVLPSRRLHRRPFKGLESQVGDVLPRPAGKSAWTRTTTRSATLVPRLPGLLHGDGLAAAGAGRPGPAREGSRSGRASLDPTRAESRR
jgi:hypothetical protein